jgi:hypothetical protein
LLNDGESELPLFMNFGDGRFASGVVDTAHRLSQENCGGEWDLGAVEVFHVAGLPSLIVKMHNAFEERGSVHWEGYS